MEDKSQYAGFWKRVGAYVIDTILMSIACGIVSFIMGLILGAIMGAMGVSKDTIVAVAGISGGLLGLIVLILYWAIFEWSSLQATPGKLALGIVVTDMNGQRIGFGRSVARQFAKFLSSVFFIGYIICGFTQKRQCVHDLITNTLVIKKDAALRLGAKDPFQIMQSP